MSQQVRDQVRRERERRRWSFRAAGRLGGIGGESWKHFEDGTTAPQTATILGIGRAFDWPADWFSRLEAGEAPGAWGTAGGLADDIEQLQRQVSDLQASIDGVADLREALEQLRVDVADVQRRLDAVGSPGRPGRASVTPLPTGGRRAAHESRYRKGDGGPPEGQEDV